MKNERQISWSLLVLTFAVRAWNPNQPIVENYVGRQIPTAMVARNLERGSGFFHPQLDTGPLPNLFLVEPPIYAQLVAVARSLFGFDWEATGRLVSAAATALGGWGLFGLARRREGVGVALLALASFGIFPVMIRYGRAFQPDALMVGCVLAGLRGWDEYEAGGNWRWAVFGGFVLAMGLALKITVAWALLPFCLILGRWTIQQRLAACVAMLAPAFAWYLLAWDKLAWEPSGSLASTDNASLWARSISPAVWLRFSTIENIARGLVIRSFTPIGFVLAFWGLARTGRLDRLWVGWGIGCGLSILGLAAKWHHAYYWMVVAPLASVGVARGLACLGRSGKIGPAISASLGSFLLALSLFQSASTWRTPPEWAGLAEAAREVAARVSGEEPVIAPEAVLYYADRKGCRLEFGRASAERAAGEWGGSLTINPGPLALADFYRTKANFPHPDRHISPARPQLVADVGPAGSDPGRKSFREAIRASPNYRVLIDRPGWMIAEGR